MRLLTTLILVLLAAPAWAGCENPQAVIKVDGMVCDFCARTIEKAMHDKIASADTVALDLTAKTVTVGFKGSPASDDALKEVISYAGYKTAAIERVCK